MFTHFLELQLPFILRGFFLVSRLLYGVRSNCSALPSKTFIVTPLHFLISTQKLIEILKLPPPNESVHDIVALIEVSSRIKSYSQCLTNILLSWLQHKTNLICCFRLSYQVFMEVHIVTIASCHTNSKCSAIDFHSVCCPRLSKRALPHLHAKQILVLQLYRLFQRLAFEVLVERLHVQLEETGLLVFA